MHVTSSRSSLISNLIKLVAIPFAIAAFAFYIYYQSVDFAFQFDDIANILKCFNVRSETFSTMFFRHSRWIATWLNAVNYRMGSGDPFAPHYYRLFNICFHILTSLVVFYFFYVGLSSLKQTEKKVKEKSVNDFFFANAFPIALFTSAVFMLHPVQSQTVSYVIQGRLEGLAGLFIMSMALCFLLYNQMTTTFSKVALGTLMIVIAALSAGTKECAFVSPFLILLVDWFFVAHGDIQDLKKRWWLHALIACAVWGMYLYFLKPSFFVEIATLQKTLPNNIGNEITENRTDLIKPWPYFISEFKVILHYLGIFLWPFNISVDYDWKMAKGFFAPDAFLPFLVLLAIGGVIALILRRNKTNLFAFGLLWFFVTIAPRASLIPSTELMADYKTYLASVGWLFVIASGIAYAVQYLAQYSASTEEQEKTSQAAKLFHGGAVFYIPIAACTVLMGIGTFERNKVWRSGEEFWANVLKNAPGRARAYNNYGVALSENGKHQEAIPHFKKAIKMDHIYPDPLNNLSVAYSALGKLDEAIEILRQGLRIHPYYPEAHNNLASFYIQKKDYTTANKFLDVALALRPHYGKAHYNRARIATMMAEEAKNEQDKLAQQELAWQSYKNAAIHGDMDNNLICLHEYARMSMTLKKYDDAVIGYSRMLTLNPALNEAVFLVANALFFKGDTQQAIAGYQEYLKRVPGDVRGLNNLGETYYQIGKFDHAVEYFAQTVQQNPGMINAQIRLAECLDHLGKTDLAKQRLTGLLGQKLPAQLEGSIKVAINQMDKRMSAVKAGVKAPRRA